MALEPLYKMRFPWMMNSQFENGGLKFCQLVLQCQLFSWFVEKYSIVFLSSEAILTALRRLEIVATMASRFARTSIIQGQRGLAAQAAAAKKSDAVTGAKVQVD
jgi:hypothetical protein